MRCSLTARRPWTFYVFAALFALFVLFLYGPMLGDLRPVVPGPAGRHDLSR